MFVFRALLQSVPRRYSQSSKIGRGADNRSNCALDPLYIFNKQEMHGIGHSLSRVSLIVSDLKKTGKLFSSLLMYPAQIQFKG